MEPTATDLAHLACDLAIQQAAFDIALGYGDMFTTDADEAICEDCADLRIAAALMGADADDFYTDDDGAVICEPCGLRLAGMTRFSENGE